MTFLLRRAGPVISLLLVLAAPLPPGLFAANDGWRPAAYADEAGFKRRTQAMVPQLAAEDYLKRSMARSVCPDTGQPVFTWALAGETILSPYTGRQYQQRDTGYFGPKQRDAAGRISAFGGDPLKHALPPATAVLLLHPDDVPARAYVSIPGNLRQQYHFACVNWVRFLGLVGPRMSPTWQEEFRAMVADYEENRRPSDGAREHEKPDPPVPEYQPLPHTENLVGRVEEHLGGGGTENHKTMWRSSGLYYAQTFPSGATVSGYPLAEAEARTTKVLGDYVRKLFTLGNGEYDSSTYVPYSFRAFSNLYDFSPKPETQAMAQAALDYYFATYGLKAFNGVHTGPQRRGWVEGDALGEMDRHLWAWAGGASSYTTVPIDPAAVSSLHQATTTYRPNQLIVDLIAKNVPLPFEARLNHPDYGMTTPGRQPEYFYCDRSFAMGSVQMDLVNNAGQQTTWSLNVRGPHGSLLFSGGQPRWLLPEGHSPYDQWVQKRGALLLMTAPTAAKPGTPLTPALSRVDQLLGARSYTRQAAYSGPLQPATRPASAEPAALSAYMAGARSQAASWLFVPRSAAVRKTAGQYVIETADTAVVITPFNADAFWLELPDGTPRPPGPAAVLEKYRILVVPGEIAGFAIEAVDRATPHDLTSARLQVDGTVATYRSIAGDTLELHYQATELRGAAVINGQAIDWTRWADGAVCDCPYLKIKDGRMWVSNGRAAYEMDYTGAAPVWRPGNR